MLAQARNPIAITRMLGKDPATVPHLVCLAQTLNLPIFDGGATHMNFPYSHRLHQPGRVDPHLQHADVIVTLESDWPWAPGHSEPHPDATVIAIDADPLLLAVGQAAWPDRPGLRFTDCDLRVAGWSDRIGLDRPADAAVSTTALHWLAEPELRAMYAELAMALAPGGVLLNGDRTVVFH